MQHGRHVTHPFSAVNAASHIGQSDPVDEDLEQWMSSLPADSSAAMSGLPPMNAPAAPAAPSMAMAGAPTLVALRRMQDDDETMMQTAQIALSGDGDADGGADGSAAVFANVHRGVGAFLRQVAVATMAHGVPSAQTLAQHIAGSAGGQIAAFVALEGGARVGTVSTSRSVPVAVLVTR